MTDREVIITHLNDLRLFADVTVHPSVSPDNWNVYASLCDYVDQIKTEIEELLKERETVEPTFKQDEDGIFVWACGSCGAYMYHIYDGIDKAKEYAKYCRQCGKKVKWK